jgi:hypothetical protein
MISYMPFRLQKTKDESLRARKRPDHGLMLEESEYHVFLGIKALCLTCARFCTASDIYELTAKYSRAESAISEVVNWLVTYIDKTWSHLLTFDYTHLLSRTQRRSCRRCPFARCLGLYRLHHPPDMSALQISTSSI